MLVLFLVLAGIPARGADAAPLSAQFTLTQEDLTRMVVALPDSVRSAIMARPADFLRLLAAVLDEPGELFLLVDKRHPLDPTYAPADLVDLKHFPLKLSWPHLLLRKAVLPDLLAMARSAAADGVTLTLTSTYRSYDYQREVFAREVKLYGEPVAERESAHPGCSQHQLGTALDFGSISDDYAQSAEGRWVTEHAWQFGFSLSYPQGYEEVTGYRHESWHYRYITPAGTILQRRYFADVQQYLLQFLHDNRTALTRARRTR